MKLQPHKKIVQALLALALLSVPVLLTAPHWLPAAHVSGQTQVQPAVSDAVPALPEPERPEPLSKRIVEYHISVRLDADKHLLHGTQTVTWSNPGKKPVGELYFHLYPNAFESKKTTFMKESGGKLRGDKMSENGFGGMTVTSIKTTEGKELLPWMKFVQPDDGNRNDRTLMMLRLPETVPSNEQITLNMNFEVKLPQVFARMGYYDDFIMAGQWFPKLSVYETKGMRGRTEEGWNNHQYHGNSEFYGDFGIYNVKIQVPSNYIVAATGFPTATPSLSGAQKIYHFYADDVHDFAWSASPRFVYSETAYSTPDLPGVRIKLYLDPNSRKFRDRYLNAAKNALARYSEWYGAYPYSTLSVVVPPAGAGGAAGMEYPTLVTAGEAGSENSGSNLERVLVHEIGHQYWYGMVATNEFEEAWLDEGFTSYTEDKLMEKEYGVSPNLPVEASYITSPASLRQTSWDYRNSGQYAENVYMRGKLVLVGIEKQIGEKMMKRVMKAYFNRWKFKHPATPDFQQTLERVTGKKWNGYFETFVNTGMMVDYAVESVGSQAIVQNGAKAYESTARVIRHGASYSPIPVVFHFTDGTSVKKTISNATPVSDYRMVYAYPVEWVAIDPDYSVVLENKHINNFMKATVSEQAKVRTNLTAASVIETLLGCLAW